MQTDVIFGRNGATSYPLSWRNVQLHSELVVCDGHPLRRDLDYTFDNVSGAIQFARPLRAGVMARITYNVDRRTPPATRLPPPRHYIGDCGRAAKTNCACAPWQKTPQTPAAFLRLLLILLTFPVRAQCVAMDGQFAASARVGPERPTGYAPVRGFAGRRLAGTRRHGIERAYAMGQNGVGLRLRQGGAQFTQAEESGLAAGQENLEAKASARPAKGVTVTGSVKQTTLLPSAPTTTPASNQAPASRNYDGSQCLRRVGIGRAAQNQTDRVPE